MLRSLHLPLISFCILLMATKCSEGCQIDNALLIEKVTKLETEHTRIIKEQQELSKQLDDLADQRDAILQATQDLNKVLQDLEKLNYYRLEADRFCECQLKPTFTNSLL